MKIVLTGGGTGGHIMPNLALVPLLNQRFETVYYLSGQKDKELVTSLCPSVAYRVCESIKLKRPIWDLSNLWIPFGLDKHKKEAIALLKELAPNLVFSKGGFASLPVVLAAKQLGIPYVLHESDFTMGLANKLVAKHAVHSLASFENAIKGQKNGLHIGSPLRKSIYEGDKNRIDTSNFDKKKPIVLVIGGSQGATAINNCTMLATPELSTHYNILHITGKKHASDFRHKNYLQIPFAFNMGDYLAASDLVVSRGGANILFELLALKKPSLIIPLPKGVSRGDQSQNTNYFAQKNCILKLDQEDLTPATLLDSLGQLHNRRQSLMEACNTLPALDGTQAIVDLLVSIGTQAK
ncbi:MAG: UDP-N-acetylglucosamine--N-acetylmuramyl-(pentapeptide) pyrophosphoryl-undecaprenol N-acetylglucosamine transferase [Firmicutes bacterium]|nr:UDP-N-acetylglucosamine--N-acetylmuramyl-(pentapeptide) pyrophosphoryl-undecaprenol N-acetylglucosamine transferase [Bacillota bacterium]